MNRIVAWSLVALVGCGRASVSAPPSSDRKTIERATLSVSVADLPVAQHALTQVLQRAGGFVARSELRREQKEGTWTLRVPAARLAETIQALSELGEVAVLRTDGEDVTDASVDLDARLSAKRTEETRLLALLDGSAALTDVLAVEKELSRVRGEVEQLAAQQKRLATDVAMATLELELSERALAAGSFGGQVGATLRASFDAMGTAVRAGVLVAVAVVPWLLPVVALVLLVRRRRRVA